MDTLLAELLDAGVQREGHDQQGDADGQPQHVGEEPAAPAVGPAEPQPYRHRERQPGDRTNQPAGPVRWPGVAGEGAQGAAPHAAQRGPHRGQDHDGGGDGKGSRGAWPRDRWGLGAVHGQDVGDAGQRRRQQAAGGQPDRGGQEGNGEVLDE
jgi:hypothetical protein